MMHAQQLHLTGSVTNLDNGMVEIYVQGETAAIDDFLGIIVKGDHYIHVMDYTIKEVPVKPGEKRFVYGWGNTYW
jgi:acylphosphatase